MKMTRHEFLKVFIVAIGGAVVACSSSDPAPSSSSGGSSSGGTDSGAGTDGGAKDGGGGGGGGGGDGGGGIDASGGGNCAANGAISAGFANVPNHNGNPHPELKIPAADFVNPSAPKTYDIGPGGGSGHTHQITLSPAELTQLASGQPVTVKSTEGNNHTHDVTLVCG
jgi:hypothetical protein